MEAAAKGQSPSAIISAGTVRLLRDYTGRGPTKAKTIIAHDSVMVVLADSLTEGERSLVESGKADHVLHTRQEFQRVMRPDLTGLVESTLDRKVIAFMSDNHIDQTWPSKCSCSSRKLLFPADRSGYAKVRPSRRMQTRRTQPWVP